MVKSFVNGLRLTVVVIPPVHDAIRQYEPVRAEVKDPEEATALQEVSVSVESTNPPDVEILTPVDGSTFL